MQNQAVPAKEDSSQQIFQNTCGGITNMVEQQCHKPKRNIEALVMENPVLSTRSEEHADCRVAGG